MGALMSYENYADSATVTNNSDGTEKQTETNVQVRQLTKVFRQSLSLTSPLESVILDFDLGSARSISYVGLFAHNIDDGTYAVYLGTSAGASDVATKTGTLWQGVSDDAKQQHVIFPQTYSAQHVRIILTPAVALEVDLGRVWIDDPWTPKVSIDYDHIVEDQSTSQRSIGASKYAYEKTKFRVSRLTLLNMTEAQALGDSTDNTVRSAHHMDVTVGTSRPLVIIPETSGADPEQVIHKTGYYGSIRTSTPITLVMSREVAGGWLYRKTLTFEEER